MPLAGFGHLDTYLPPGARCPVFQAPARLGWGGDSGCGDAGCARTHRRGKSSQEGWRGLCRCPYSPAPSQPPQPLRICSFPDGETSLLLVLGSEWFQKVAAEVAGDIPSSLEISLCVGGWGFLACRAEFPSGSYWPGFVKCSAGHTSPELHTNCRAISSETERMKSSPFQIGWFLSFPREGEKQKGKLGVFCNSC